MQISQQTMALARRLQANSDRPLAQRQAIRRAMWLQEQTRVLQEQLADYHRQRPQPE
ncbi:MAG: hypothetical protein WBG32_00900 [Nodosilinea sp.]